MSAQARRRKASTARWETRGGPLSWRADSGDRSGSIASQRSSPTRSVVAIAGHTPPGRDTGRQPYHRTSASLKPRLTRVMRRGLHTPRPGPRSAGPAQAAGRGRRSGLRRTTSRTRGRSRATRCATRGRSGPRRRASPGGPPRARRRADGPSHAASLAHPVRPLPPAGPLRPTGAARSGTGPPGTSRRRGRTGAPAACTSWPERSPSLPPVRPVPLTPRLLGVRGVAVSGGRQEERREVRIDHDRDARSSAISTDRKTSRARRRSRQRSQRRALPRPRLPVRAGRVAASPGCMAPARRRRRSAGRAYIVLATSQRPAAETAPAG